MLPKILIVILLSSTTLAFTATDPLLSLQWGLEAIHAPEAWTLLPNTHPRALVAVLDTGVDWKVPDLSDAVINIHSTDAESAGLGEPLTLRGFNFAPPIEPCLVQTPPNPLTNPYCQIPPDEILGPMDFSGHGTHVAGIIAATHNNIGTAGVSDAYILPIKVLINSNSLYNINAALALGIETATSFHPQVISISLGTPDDDPLIAKAVQNAEANNILIVAAAGNSNTSTPLYPADYPGVMKIGATNPDGTVWNMSNYGENMSLVAPGVNILSTGSRWYSNFGLYYRGESYVNMTGTSMAAPHVSAVAALAWEACPLLSAPLIRQILEQTASGNQTWNPHQGWGTINAEQALRVTSGCRT